MQDWLSKRAGEVLMEHKERGPGGAPNPVSAEWLLVILMTCMMVRRHVDGLGWHVPSV